MSAFSTISPVDECAIQASRKGSDMASIISCAKTLIRASMPGAVEEMKMLKKKKKKEVRNERMRERVNGRNSGVGSKVPLLGEFLGLLKRDERTVLIIVWPD